MAKCINLVAVIGQILDLYVLDGDGQPHIPDDSRERWQELKRDLRVELNIAHV